MSSSDIFKPPGGPSGVQADTKDEIKNVRHFDLIDAQIHGGNKEQGPSSLEQTIFQGNRAPLNGVDLGAIGAEYGIQFAVNPNPKEGFTVRFVDSKQSVDELTEYQIMKGGYDGRMRLLIEYHRAYAPGLNDPYVTITMFQKELAVDKLTDQLPEGIKPGTLMEWREHGWREEAKKILRSVNGYNPITREVLRITRKQVSSEVTPEESGFELRHEDQQIFHEEETLDVVSTPLQNLPKIRYLEPFFRCLQQVQDALGYK